MENKSLANLPTFILTITADQHGDKIILHYPESSLPTKLDKSMQKINVNTNVQQQKQ